MGEYICHCLNVLRQDVKLDEKPDGTILGYPIWKCTRCGKIFNEEDLRKENIVYAEDDAIYINDSEYVSQCISRNIEYMSKKIMEEPKVIKCKLYFDEEFIGESEALTPDKYKKSCSIDF